MKERVVLIVPVEPVAKPRPRFNRKTGAVYYPGTEALYENYVRILAKERIDRPHSGPVRIHLTFCFKRPKNKIYKRKAMNREYKPTRPDLDNLIKSVLDGLNGVAFLDDSQVVEIKAVKYICGGGEDPHTEIEIYFEEVIGVGIARQSTR